MELFSETKACTSSSHFNARFWVMNSAMSAIRFVSAGDLVGPMNSSELGHVFVPDGRRGKPNRPTIWVRISILFSADPNARSPLNRISGHRAYSSNPDIRALQSFRGLVHPITLLPIHYCTIAPIQGVRKVGGSSNIGANHVKVWGPQT
jgi:hypothetical protein